MTEVARFIKDIERCPYVPKDSEYDEWNRQDQERLKNINKDYDNIYKTAIAYLLLVDSEHEPYMKLMCEFVIDMLKPR